MLFRALIPDTAVPAATVLPLRPGTTLHFVSFGLPKVRRCRRVAEWKRKLHVVQGFRLVDCPGIPSRHQAELEITAGDQRLGEVFSGHRTSSGGHGSLRSSMPAVTTNQCFLQ